MFYRYRLLLAMASALLLISSPAAAAEVLRYVGATTLQRAFMPEMARVFQAETGVRLSIEGGNTDPGLRALLAGEADMAGAGRMLTAAEKRQGLVEHFLGWDVLAIVVNRDNPLASLTGEQLQRIFTGDLRNWQQVGGPDQAITVITTPQGSGMRAAVQELILKDRVLTSAVIVSGVVAQTDQQVAMLPGTIAALSLSMVDARNAKVLAVSGVEPSAGTVRDGHYPLVKPLLLVTRGQPRGELRRFIELAVGPRGQAIFNKQFVAAKPRQ